MAYHDRFRPVGSGMPEVALRVDFLGPPAVGKTSLCSAFLTSGEGSIGSDTQQVKWMSIDQALELAARNVFRCAENRMSWGRRAVMFAALMRHGVKQFVLKGYRKSFELTDLQRVKCQLFEKFLSGHNQLLEVLSDQWFDPEAEMPPLTLRHYEMSKWVMNWLLATHLSGPVQILADNSRLTRGVSELLMNDRYSNEVRESALREYLWSSLRPGGVVHLDGSASLVLERARERKLKGNGEHSAHRGLSDQELIEYNQRRSEVNRNAVTEFRSLGIPVITLSASAETSENLDRMSQFLERVAADPTRSEGNDI